MAMLVFYKTIPNQFSIPLLYTWWGGTQPNPDGSHLAPETDTQKLS